MTEDVRDTYWFVGGPLDGRVSTRPAAEEAPAVVRHVHLHEGPKIVHHYDLYEVAGHGGEYRLRLEQSPDLDADGEPGPRHGGADPRHERKDRVVPPAEAGGAAPR